MQELIPNWTFFIQLGIFLASFFVLKVLVFGPYLELIHARHARTTGFREEARQLREQSEKLKAEYEETLRNERKKVSTWFEGQRQELAEEERAILSKARDEVAAQMGELRGQIADDVKRARNELSPLVVEYSSSIASKLVGHTITIPKHALGAQAELSTEESLLSN